MQIIRQLIEIILRKRQPQDLAYDLNAAVIGAVGITGLGYLVYSKMPGISQPLFYNAAMVVFQAIGIYALLAMNNKANRFVQTITAIFGVSLILQVLTIASGQIPILAMFGLILTVWNFILIVFILRSALECSTLKATLLTFAYHFFMGILMVMVFPKFPLELQAVLETMSSAAVAPK